MTRDNEYGIEMDTEWQLAQQERRMRDAGCTHGLDRRCPDCATDDEVLASLPPFPGS